MKRTEESAWRAEPRWRIRRDGEIALGPGKADLLAAISRVGSITGAARELAMSYRRAWLLVEAMNRCFRRPLVTTSSWRRSGAALTDEGRVVLAIYRQVEATSRAAARRPLARLKRRLVP